MTTQLVLPGESLPILSSSNITLGPGIASSSTTSNGFISTKLGLLKSSAGKSSKGKEKGTNYWIESNTKRYIPSQKELVLGTIIARHAEGYRVDIGSSQMAQLDALAFEGATKRSKPNLKIGTLLYARVSLAHRDMEPEIECFDPSTGKSEGFGELKGGLVVDCSLQFCRQLMNPKYPLLPTLAAHVAFEICLGMNGKVWFKSTTISEGIALKRVLEAVDSGDLRAEDKQLVERSLKEYMS